MKNVVISLLVILLAVSVGLWTKTTRMLTAAQNDVAVAAAEIQRLVSELKKKERSPAVASATPAESSFAQMPVSAQAQTSEPATAPALSNTNVPTAQGVPPMTEATASAIDRFDHAMDREFDRLEDREQKTTDAAEVTTIQKIKDKLSELDELYRRSDNTTAPEEKAEIAAAMQETMGSIISLSRVDRNERLGKLATDIGYADPNAVEQFVREIDRIYHETHMDWAKLFNRAPPQ